MPVAAGPSRRNASACADVLADLDGLDETVAHETSGGEAYGTAVGDVLVLLHAAYHRGQTNAALHAVGATPPWVDFVAWVLQGEPGV